MRQLYVCSRPIHSADGNLHRHLIGILSQLDNGTYRFEYTLDSSAISKSLMLPIFPRKDKIYNDTETRVLLDDYLPSEKNTSFMNDILKKAGFNDYDEWTWLLTFDSDDPDAETVLYESLPDDIIRHDLDPDLDIDDESDDYIDMFDDIIAEADNPEDIDDIDDEDTNDISDLLDDFNIPDDLFNNIAIDDDNQISDEISQESQSEPKISEKKFVNKNVITTIVTKTTYKRKMQHTIDDFIESPPEFPLEKIQQRLLENEKQRQLELMKKMTEINSCT